MLPLAIGALAVVAIGVIAIALSQGGGTGATPAGSASSSLGSGASVGPATVTGPALARYAEGDDPAVGEPIPEVRGSGFDGTPVTIARDGTPKLLLFLAHWCPHCREEVPKIQDWVDANGMPEGVDFVSIATGINANQPNYPPDAWLAREGWTPPVLVDADDAVAEAYGLAAYPYWVAVNGDGTVAARRTGAVPAEELSGLFEGLRATAPSAAPTVSGSADGS